MSKRRKVLAHELAAELQGMPRMSDTGIHTVVSKTLKSGRFTKRGSESVTMEKECFGRTADAVPSALILAIPERR